jgi:hypothetical protein
MIGVGVIHLGAEVLAKAEEFLTGRGAEGLEGTGLIACGAESGGVWKAVAFVAPEQSAHRAGSGCWVEVTDRGKRELAVRLPAGCRYLVRIHSHPGEAFHSRTDDANPALTHDGAVSIVIPYFGLGLRKGLDACAVYHRMEGRWRDLRPGTEREQWVVADG